MADRSIPWTRILAEAVAIVGSILLAFGIQALWEGSQERGQARRDLESVEQELAVNRETVASQLNLMARMATGGAAVTEILRADRVNGVTALPDTLAFLVTSTAPTLDPSTGALDALIASGRLTFVGDDEVRRRLSGLGDLFEDARENQLYVNDLIENRVYPETANRFDNASVIEVSSEFYNRAETGVRPPDRALVHQTTIEFPNNVGVRNVVRYWTFSMTSAVREMRTVLSELDEILQQLRVQPDIP